MKYEILEWMSHGQTTGYGVIIYDRKKNRRMALTESVDGEVEVIRKPTRKEAIEVAKEYIQRNK